MKIRVINSRLGLLVLLLSLLVIHACQKEDIDTPEGPNVDLSISSTLDKEKPELEEIISYTIIAKNLSSDAASEVAVADTLPEGLQLDSFSATSGTYDPKTGIWTIGNLPTSATQTLTIKAKVVSYGYMSNIAWIKGKETDPDKKNNNSETALITKLTGLSTEQTWSFDIYAAMKEIYLWNNAIPNAFDPRKYVNPENALDYLSQLKINDETKKPIDKYSFLDKIGGLSGEIGEGKKSGDYGFMIKAAINEDNLVAFYVNYVYTESAAGKAGVKRSYEIIEVNGSSDVHPTIKDGSYLDTESSGFKNVVDALTNSTSARFKFKKPDGTFLETSLTLEDFNINSVLYTSIFEVNAKKVGYIVFKQFLDEKSVTELKDAFAKLESKGISELIVDLRYNGGGSVATCEKLSSMIAPPSTNGQVMHYTVYNKLLDEYFKSKEGNEYNITKFKKENSLAINRAFFIVSGNTASASELLINNLKPYMDVKLIGDRTYGKPCGFWATPIGYDRKSTAPKVGYDLYAVSFETLNSKKEGRYYSGIPVDKEARDGFWYDWGDAHDPCLGQALYYIANGKFEPSKKSAMLNLKSNIDRSFIGMIDYRGHK